jgi:hypothetical protein
MFPTKQNEVIQEQEKFLENQLSQIVRKIPKGKRQLFEGVINFPHGRAQVPQGKGKLLQEAMNFPHI